MQDLQKRNMGKLTKVKNWCARHKIITGILVIFILGAMANNGNSSSNSPKKDQTETTKTETLPQTQVVASNEKLKTEPEKPKTKIDLLWEAFDQSNVWNKQDYEITFDEKTGEAQLIQKVNDDINYWDEYDMVAQAYKNFVKFGLKAFQVDGVKKVKFIEKTLLKDKYGKEFPDDGVIVAMTKDQFTKFDWENMKGQPIHSSKYDNDFDEVFVNMAIAKVVNQNPDKIKLSF